MEQNSTLTAMRLIDALVTSPESLTFSEPAKRTGMQTNFTQRKFLIICILFLVTIVVSKESFSQLTAGAPAKFGIDGDVKNDFKISGTFNATGTHDWFNLTSGTGMGVIDTTNTNSYKVSLSAGNNITFNQGMSIPRYTTVDGSVLLDARYGRDYFGSTSGDLTTFGGGSKNGDNPTIWGTNPGGANIPDKADIIDTYVHMRRDGVVVAGSNPSHIIAYVGISTASTNGNRYFDAEFYCSRLTYNTGTGAFSNSGPAATGGHTPWIFNADGSIQQFGDMSLSFSFNSSIVNEIYVMVWVSHSNFSTVVPTGFDFVPGEYYGSAGGYGYAKIKAKSGTTTAWGIGNTAATTATPWGTTSLTLGSSSNNYYYNNYDIGQFGEAAIDLTALGIDPVLLPGNNPCSPPFTRILFKSRASSSFTSALKDFAGPYEFLDVPVPSSAIGTVSNLTCLNTSVILSPQTYIEGVYYKWTTNNGSIPGNPETPSITITQPGTYYFQSAAYKGCTPTTDSIIVSQDIYKPKASAYVTNVLTNTIPTATLLGGDTTASKYNNAIGTYQGLTWAWSGPNSFSSAFQDPVVNQTGVYTIIVSQKSNGCKDTALTNVLDSVSGHLLLTNDIIFTAARDDKSKIKITWTVRGFINSFELYRSTDGNTFQSIALIFPDSTATMKNNYKDDVSTLSAGTVYYKLKWTDKSGKINFSTIVKVGLGGTMNIQVIPNPYMDKLNVNFVSDASGNAEVRLISASGNLVKITSSITKGYNNIQLQDLHSQAPGLYIANIIINGKVVASLKVLKQ